MTAVIVVVIVIVSAAIGVNMTTNLLIDNAAFLKNVKALDTDNNFTVLAVVSQQVRTIFFSNAEPSMKETILNYVIDRQKIMIPCTLL